jgi:hypothetical protein
MDMDACYDGEPVGEMPRERLIAIIIELARDNDRLRKRECEVSVQRVRDLAAMARSKRPWWAALGGTDAA